MNKTILILAGDGIGQEVTQQAIKLFHWFNNHTPHHFTLIEDKIGGCAIDACGHPLPASTLAHAKKADSILLGAVGGPKWDAVAHEYKPEKGLLALRKTLGLYANLRPATLFPALIDASPLKKEYIANLDLMIVRELTGDVYFGEPRGIFSRAHEQVATNTMVYSTHEIERIARTALDLARSRKKKVCSVDKANVLETSLLWRQTVQAIRDQDYPDIHLSHMYVDNAAMQLIRYPHQFDVIVTGNLFGDILSDQAAMLTGSLGMLPSASLGKQYALYEPIHGSAPDIAGKNKANPLATLLSVAMMLHHTFQLDQEAEWIQQAVNAVLNQGYRTQDILTADTHLVSTAEMGDKVIAALSAFQNVSGPKWANTSSAL